MGDLKVPFDHYHIPVRKETIEKFIRLEMEKLSKKTGLPLLPIEFVDNPGGSEITVACFEYYIVTETEGRPHNFQFNNKYFDKLSAHQLTCTVRHEFAHYVRLMRHGICNINQGHDKLWENICIELDCPPERFYIEHITTCIVKEGA